MQVFRKIAETRQFADASAIRRRFSAKEFKEALLLVPSAALVLDADENRVVADLLDIAPGNDDILAASEKAEKLAPAVDHERHDTAVGRIDLHIAHIAEPAAILDIDDVFAA
jgi:hypothetical protein